MKKLTVLIVSLIVTGIAYGEEQPVSIVRLLEKSTWEIGPEIYHYEYEEPGVMENEGMFYGVSGAYTRRAWVSESSEESLPDKKWMWRFEARYASGEVDYDGALTDGTPYTVDNIDDYVMELRLLAGPDFLTQTSMDTLYFGIGFRYLNDDGSSDPAGYERESTYWYIPIGLRTGTIKNMDNNWSFGATAEFDLFLKGEQNTHLSDVGLLDIENEQDSGYGLRGSVRFQKHGEKTDFIIEPFIRYWNIDKSDVVYGGYEPANETLEYGAQLIWRF